MGVPEERLAPLCPYCNAPIVGESSLLRNRFGRPSGGLNYQDLECLACARCGRVLAMR